MFLCVCVPVYGHCACGTVLNHLLQGSCVTSQNSYLNYHHLSLCLQEYKRKQLEEQRQAERLQRQLQQERAYLVSLQQQQQQDSRPGEKKQLYHYKDAVNPSDKPAWAKEVGKPEIRLNLSCFQHRSTALLQG